MFPCSLHPALDRWCRFTVELWGDWQLYNTGVNPVGRSWSVFRGTLQSRRLGDGTLARLRELQDREGGAVACEGIIYVPVRSNSSSSCSSSSST